MNKQKLFIGIILVVFFGIFYSVLAQSTQQGIIQLEIKGLGIRHGTPDNQNLGTVMASSNDQEISGQFTDYFRVEDIEGYTTGHYTTIQCNGVYNTSYGNKLTGIYLMAGNPNPELLMGMTGPNVFINSGLYSYTSILTPVTYIYKLTSVDNIGIVNRYGDKPRLKIFIPAGTPPGTYSGTIVFSFYIND